MDILCVICDQESAGMVCENCKPKVAALRQSLPADYAKHAFGAEPLESIPYGLITGDDLHALVTNRVITGLRDKDQVNAASIDITLGYKVLHEVTGIAVRTLRDRQPLAMREQLLDQHSPFIMKPGEFILGHSNETFNLPNNISALYTLKSSMARIGLNHLNAGWCDAGWNNSVLTLELQNVTRYHDIGLVQGDRIGQMLFFKHPPVPEAMSYANRGRYNGDNTVKGIKP